MFRFSIQFSKAFPVIFLIALLIGGAAATFAQENDDDSDARADAVQYFNQGQDAHEKGDLETALKLYARAIALVPEFPEAEYQRGTAFRQLGKSADAEKAYRRALELRPDWSLPMAQLGDLLVRKKQFDEAEPLLTKALELDGQNFPALFALTELRLRTKAAPEILRELLEKIRVLTGKANPPASVWTARAALERSLGDRDAAKTSINNALAIAPNNQSALAENVEIALAQNDFNSAVRDAKKLTQMSPDSIDDQILLARVFFAAGNSAEAEKILNALDQTDAAVIELKKSLTSGGDDAAELEKIIAADPKNIAALGNLCVLNRKTNPVKSMEYCRRALEIEPDNINFAVAFGAALLQTKDFQQTASLLTKLKPLAPDNYILRANLATALFELKRYAEAKNEYQWLTEKQPETAAAYYFLAVTHDRLAEYVDALANYQKFLQLADPKISQLEIEKVNLRLPILQRQISREKKKK